MKKALILVVLSMVTILLASEVDIEKSKGTNQSVIASLTPNPASITVNKDMTIKATFTIPLDKSHVKKNDIKLKQISDETHIIDGDVSYKSDEKAVLFEPSQSLEEGYYEIEFKSLKPTKEYKSQQIKEIKYRFYVPEVLPDITPPVITLNGDSNITLFQDDIYNELGAMATDDQDDNISVVVSGNVNTSTVGIYILTYTAIDKAGNSATKTRTVNIVLAPDTTPPVVTLNGKETITLIKGEIYSEQGATAIDDRDGNLSVSIRGEINTSVLGNYTINYTAIDSAGNSSTVTRTIIVEEPPTILTSLQVTPNPISLRINSTLQLTVVGTFNDGHTEVLTDSVDYTIDDTNIASIDSSGVIEGLQEGTTTVQVSLDSINSSVITVSILDTLDTSNFNFTTFGYQYQNQIPTDATVDGYDENRFCMIAGQILAEDGTPLSGVKVSIFNHTEYGSALTDDNGTYVIPSEGGLQLTMRYTKEGYTTIDRKIDAPIQDWVRSPDVTMLQEDSKVTVIDLTQETPQVHISTPVNDDRGERSTTLVFDGITKATVTAKDGTTRELTSINVRATEFKTASSMPSDLPIETAYTYCSDLKVDGVRDDENVTFDSPVIMYVDNFLGFDIGAIVPIGYYDRNDGEWKASDNGIVVKLLDLNNDGKIDALDSTGDDNPNDLNGNGSFSDEVAGIINNDNYEVGQSYWRAKITHFTPWDHNWPYGPEGNEEAPDEPDVDTDDNDDTCKVDINSYVEPKQRVFHEDIPIQGTDITLHYSSKRVDGYKYSVKVSVAKPAPSAAIETIVEFNIAGKRYTNTTSSLSVPFIWDSLDVLGKQTTGKVTGNVRVGYVYNMVYYESSTEWEQAWAQLGNTPTSIQGRDTITLWSDVKTVELNVDKLNSINTNKSDQNNSTAIANGWALSSSTQASKDILIQGNGENIKQDMLAVDNIRTTVQTTIDAMARDTFGNFYLVDRSNNQIKKVNPNGHISVIAGNGQRGYSGDGGSAIDAMLSYPFDITVDTEGNLYIADYGNKRIRKVDTNGIITTVAGNGNLGTPSDGRLATRDEVNNPISVMVDKIGNLYIGTGTARIRKVDINGIITTIAGNGQSGYSGDGEVATTASIKSANSIATDRTGNLYFVDKSNNCVRKVDTNGIITTIAGNGQSGYSGDGEVAEDALLSSPFGIFIDNDDNIYVTDNGNYRIRKIDTNGIITTIAGNGQSGYSGDGGRALDASFQNLSDLIIDNTKNMYILDNNRIREVLSSNLFEQYGLNANQFFYKHMDNTASIFNKSGTHLKTIDLTTGNTLKEFEYDENNQLVSIINQFNQATTITRDVDGKPTHITAPNGQSTLLNINENGDLIEVGYEDNSNYAFEYDSGSLMTKEIDPNGNEFIHEFDTTGRFVKDIDAIGGIWEFDKTENANIKTYTMTKPEGDIQQLIDEEEENGSITSKTILPSGDIITSVISADTSHLAVLKDGVYTNLKYGIDSLTGQREVIQTITKQPSGLTQTVLNTTNYDGNRTHTKTKTYTINHNSKVTTLLNDYINGIETITSPENRTIIREYNPGTRLSSTVTRGTLIPTEYTYDTYGQQVSTISRGSRKFTYTYNSRGNVATITDALNRVTKFSYDIMDRVTQITYPDGTAESYQYDNNGNMTKFTTPRSSMYDFAFNGIDQRTSMKSPLGKTTSYTYNKNRRLIQVTKPSGRTIVNNYTNDQLSNTVTSEGTTHYTYLFANKVGSITKSSESFSFDYDGTLITKITQTGILNQIINYGYNNDFQVNSSTYADLTQNYSYDNDGLLINSGNYSIIRDAQNGYTTQITDEILTQNRAYNNYGEISEMSDNLFAYQLTQRDNTGAITQKSETLDGATTTYDYTYDDLGRLVEVKKEGTTIESYSYDTNGNRANATVNGVTTTGQYTLDDQLVVYGDNSYRYDNDGYLVEKTTPEGTTTYEYGTLGELRKVVTPTKTIEYLHNANNQRVAKKVDGEIVEKYLWANLTTLLATYDRDDNLIQRFEYADGRMPISMTMNGQKYYLHYDQVGSLRVVSNDSLNILKEITYDTYGNILGDSNPALQIPFGFAGGLYDQDTKLTRFGYRDYDAYTGKWTAKDPIDFAGGDSNLYGYVLGNPVNFIDPSGKSWASAVLMGVGAYLLYDTISDWYNYLDRSVNNIDNSEPCSSPEEALDTYEQYERNRRDRVRDQLNNSVDIGQESTIDVLTHGIPLGTTTQTGVDAAYEFGK